MKAEITFTCPTTETKVTIPFNSDKVDIETEISGSCNCCTYSRVDCIEVSCPECGKYHGIEY